MRKTKQNSGIVTLIFLLILSLIATLILIVGQSRLLLALQRGKSASDTLITSYQAEFDINDLLARLTSGSLKEEDFDQFPITKEIGENFTLVIDGEIEGNNQILTVTSKKLFAVSKIQAVRAVREASDIKKVDLVLTLDCTGSMSAASGPGSTTTRMEEQKNATLSFIDNISKHPNGDFIKLGIAIFGIDSKWLTTTDGREIKPNSQVSLADIKNAVENRFHKFKSQSSACEGNIMDSTSIGSGFAIGHDYFTANAARDIKPVQVLISDGEPNSRMPYAACSPSVFCPGTNGNDGYNYCSSNPHGWSCANQGFACYNSAINMMKCTLAKSDNGGIRPDNVDTYSVTVLENPPRDVVDILTQNSKRYFNVTTADKLGEILETIFEDIVGELSTTTINRVIPLEQE